MTDKNTGLRLTYPSELNQVIEYKGPYEDAICFVKFDFTKEPFNGEYTEDCSSFLSIQIFKQGYKINLDNDDRSCTTLKADDGTNIYIIGKYENKSAVGYDFARDSIPCWGTIEVDPAFYKKYESAIIDMIKSMTIVQEQE